MISLGLQPLEEDAIPLPEFASVWWIDEEIWKANLSAQDYKSRNDRRHHPGVSCIDYNQIGRHSFVKFLFGSSSKRNKKARELLPVISPTRNDPNHITYFGAYDPLEKTKYAWDSYVKGKKALQNQTTKTIRVDPSKLRTYLDAFFTVRV